MYAIAALPGMDRVTTRMMRGTIEDNGVVSIEELIDVSLDSGIFVSTRSPSGPAGRRRWGVSPFGRS